MEALTPVALYLLMLARLPALLRSGRDEVFFASLLTGTAALLTVPGAYIIFDSVLGGQNWAKLAQHVMMVAGLWFIRAGIIDAITPAHERGTRKPSALPVLTTQVLQASAFMAIGAGATTTDFRGVYNETLPGAVFYLIVVIYTGWVCAEIALVSHRFLPDMRGSFRAGFTLVAIGGYLGACSSAAFVIDVVATVVPPLGWLMFHHTSLPLFLELIPTALIGIGLTIPAVAGQISRSRTRRWEKVTIAALLPISDRVLAIAGTDRALQSDPKGPLSDQLHRLVVEIWDAEQALGTKQALTPEDRAYLLEVESALGTPQKPSGPSR